MELLLILVPVSLGGSIVFVDIVIVIIAAEIVEVHIDVHVISSDVNLRIIGSINSFLWLVLRVMDRGLEEGRLHGSLAVLGWNRGLIEDIAID